MAGTHIFGPFVAYPGAFAGRWVRSGAAGTQTGALKRGVGIKAGAYSAPPHPPSSTLNLQPYSWMALLPPFLFFSSSWKVSDNCGVLAISFYCPNNLFFFKNQLSLLKELHIFFSIQGIVLNLELKESVILYCPMLRELLLNWDSGDISLKYFVLGAKVLFTDIF